VACVVGIYNIIGEAFGGVVILIFCSSYGLGGG
jgi:hypothetical protein